MNPNTSALSDDAITNAVGEVTAGLINLPPGPMTDALWLVVIRNAVLKGAVLATDHARDALMESALGR